MNGKDLLNSMTEINPEYITEAEQSEMKISYRKNKNLIRVISAVAAAAVMGVTAGAVSKVFIHRETVESYLYGDSRERLEEQELVSNYVTENEHFRMTMEMILNDGFQLYMIATLEPLDEEAQKFLETYGSFGVDSEFHDTDTGELLWYHGSAGFHTENGKNLMEFQYGFENLQSQSAEMTFSLRERDYPGQSYLMEGLTVPVNFISNLEVLEFQNEDGESVWLSPFEMYSHTQDCNTTPIQKIYLVKHNNFRIELNNDFNLSGLSTRSGASALHGEIDGEPYSYTSFDKIINIAEYQAIEFKDMNSGTIKTYSLKTE